MDGVLVVVGDGSVCKTLGGGTMGVLRRLLLACKELRVVREPIRPTWWWRVVVYGGGVFIDQTWIKRL